MNLYSKLAIIFYYLFPVGTKTEKAIARKAYLTIIKSFNKKGN